MVHSKFFPSSKGTFGAGVLGAGLALVTWSGFAHAQARSESASAQREPTALERLRSVDSTARVKEPTLGEAKIPEPANLTPAGERPVQKRASVQAVLPEEEPSPGFINESVLRSQVNQRRRELETCRPPGSKAALAPMQLRWTIVPGGHVKNTVVMTERQPASLEVVKCVRKRMDSWVFASPAGGPVDVETTHTFMAPRGRALEKEMTASTAKRPQGEQLQQARQETGQSAQPSRPQPARATTTAP
ncbi:MAG TPA: hypothetical protein VGF45_17430 [Polyangia bacterium]